MLSGISWIFALGPVLLRTHTCAHTRTGLLGLQSRHARSLLDLPLSMRCMQRLLRFRMGCHKLPRDTGCWLRVPRLNRFCTLCQQGVLGDEKHLVFECPALQDCMIGMRTCFKHLKVMP